MVVHGGAVAQPPRSWPNCRCPWESQASERWLPGRTRSRAKQDSSWQSKYQNLYQIISNLKWLMVLSWLVMYCFVVFSRKWSTKNEEHIGTSTMRLRRSFIIFQIYMDFSWLKIHVLYLCHHSRNYISSVFLLAEALQWSCCLQWSSQPRTSLKSVIHDAWWLGPSSVTQTLEIQSTYSNSYQFEFSFDHLSSQWSSWHSNAMSHVLCSFVPLHPSCTDTGDSALLDGLQTLDFWLTVTQSRAVPTAECDLHGIGNHTSETVP